MAHGGEVAQCKPCITHDSGWQHPGMPAQVGNASGPDYLCSGLRALPVLTLMAVLHVVWHMSTTPAVERPGNAAARPHPKTSVHCGTATRGGQGAEGSVMVNPCRCQAGEAGERRGQQEAAGSDNPTLPACASPPTPAVQAAHAAAARRRPHVPPGLPPAAPPFRAPPPTTKQGRRVAAAGERWPRRVPRRRRCCCRRRPAASGWRCACAAMSPADVQVELLKPFNVACAVGTAQGKAVCRRARHAARASPDRGPPPGDLT